MFISASCAVIVASIITCIVRFPLWLSLSALLPLSLHCPLSLCVFVCLDDTMSLWVCLHAGVPWLAPRPLRLFECFSFCIINCIFHASASPAAPASGRRAAPRQLRLYPLLLLLLLPLLLIPLLAIVSAPTPSVSPPVAAAPSPPPSLAGICKGNAFQLHFVFTTCSALCSFYGICWRCFALISFHCPRAAACLLLFSPCSSLLVTLALEVSWEWAGGGGTGSARDTKAVNLCTRQTQNPTPSAMVSSLRSNLPLPAAPSHLPQLFPLARAKSICSVSSARHSSSSRSSFCVT